MRLKYISSLILVMLVTSCSGSHTDRIKHELGKNYNSVTYENAGGEYKSKERYQIFCSAIKEHNYTKELLEYKALKEISNTSDLLLINAEIELANKDCK